MARVFDRNIFIMLLAIMLGTLIITYFIADIVHRSTIETLTTEIEDINIQHENLMDHFLRSSVIYDSAVEDRAYGNYHFDLASNSYNKALTARNSTLMEEYKELAIEDCTNALPYYLNSYNNFELANEKYNETKSYTSYYKYLDILDLYVELTKSGSRLTMLRYDASRYLMYLTENLTFVNDGVEYLQNVTDLLELFNETQSQYQEESDNYEEIKDDIDEYEFFDEKR